MAGIKFFFDVFPAVILIFGCSDKKIQANDDATDTETNSDRIVDTQDSSSASHDKDTSDDTDSLQESPTAPDDTGYLSDSEWQSDIDTGQTSDSNTDTLSQSDSDDPVGTATEPPVESDSTDTSGPVCSEQKFEIDYLPAKLMIALDASGSMISPEDNYSFAVEAITMMLRSFEGRFLFGFDTYPDRFSVASCAVSDPAWFDCAANNEEAIISWLETNRPANGAADPLLLEMNAFLENPQYAPNFVSGAMSGQSYLLIVADGDDCCGSEGRYDCDIDWKGALIDATKALVEAGIRVVTIGYTASADADTLSAIAENGGTEFTEYISALDHVALQAALNTIAGSLVSCQFEIADPGPSADPNKVNFYLDNEVVPFDENCQTGIGWTWDDADHTRMRFCQEACTTLESGDIHRVTAKFGCPVVILV